MRALPETRNQGCGASLFPIPGSLRLARPLRWEFAFLFVIGIVFWGGYLLHEGDALRLGYKADFLGIYLGPRMLASGAGPQLYDLPAQTVFSAAVVRPYKRSIMPFVYPAYVAVIMRPLGLLEFRSALKVWFLVNLTAVFWSAIRLARFFGCTGFQLVAVLVIFLAWPPLQLTLIQGQMGLMPTVGFTEALIALCAGREWRAGCWLSLGLLKPQMILLPLLWFALRRSWRVLVPFAAIGAGAAGISFAAVGFWIPQYLHFLAEYNHRGAELALYPIAMQNWRGLAFWLFGNEGGWGSRVLVLLLTGLSVLALVFLIYCSGPESDSESRHSIVGQEVPFMIVIVLGLLSSPHLYAHDWVAALPSGFVLWSFARKSYLDGIGLNGTGSNMASAQASAALLWLIGLAPLMFFIRQFLWAPIIPVYGFVLVCVALLAWSKPTCLVPAGRM
jgi:hypothetical protein